MSDACLLCAADRCRECAEVVTPQGALCAEHAEKLRVETGRGGNA